MYTEIQKGMFRLLNRVIILRSRDLYRRRSRDIIRRIYTDRVPLNLIIMITITAGDLIRTK